MSELSHLRAPGPRGHFLLGNLREFRRDVLGLVTGAAAEYGDVVRTRLGPHVVHLLNHPDHVGHVLQGNAANYDKATRSSASIRSVTGESLLTSNGDFWKRQRRMDQPAFHHAQIAGLTDKMTTATAEMLDRWQIHADTGGPIDMASEMARLTYAIVGRCLFSFNTDDHAGIVERAMKQMLPHLFKRLGFIVTAPHWIPTPENRRFRKALADVDRVVYEIISQHRQAGSNGIPRNDLLTMLMQARDPDTDEPLTDSQLRNETITFLLAGHETTANALTWTFHLISQNPEVGRLLLEEIRALPGGRPLRIEDMALLRFTKQVIQESMRLYPPIWIIERRAIREDTIGGFHIPAGSSVVISPYALHRHPAYWDRPNEFDPSRFSESPPPAYIPFGAGPRFCIGHEFALLEARLIVAMVMRVFEFREVPDQTIEPMPDITLRAKYGVKMTLHRRTD